MAAGAMISSATDSSLLQLSGKIVDEWSRVRTFRITLYSVDSAFSTYTLTDPDGEFHFRKLTPGNYTISVLRHGLGEIHRTIVVTASLADKKGVVRITLPFSSSEAAEGGSSALVSRNQLAIPGKARAKFREGARRMSKHDTQRARLCFDEAVRIAPKYSAAWNSLGVIAYLDGRFDDAESNFRKATEAEPGAFDPQVNLGGVLLNLNHPEEALKYNQKAEQVRPKDALANAQLGMNYFALGRADQAEGYLKEAESIDPAQFSQPQWFLAAIYSARGDLTAAIRELRDLIKRHPDGSAGQRARRALARLETQKTPDDPAGATSDR
jgi:Tfp pilus assembly protein PilF